MTQLEEGDLVIIDNLKETIYYEVFGNSVIEPTDLAALAIVPGQDMITLLTCISPPTTNRRYLVFAKRIEDQSVNAMRETFLKEEEGEEGDQGKANLSNLVQYNEIFIKRYGSVILVLGLGLIIMYFAYREPKK